ncbi:hypothetical protein C4K18_3087 [Pseudomonas chlororaphis subsp. aurantiaca]|nr:hypothetical protein C4K18_3087 [Pseudomonas chlororaphis subsp. aurantiaca]
MYIVKKAPSLAIMGILMGGFFNHPFRLKASLARHSTVQPISPVLHWVGPPMSPGPRWEVRRMSLEQRSAAQQTLQGQHSVGPPM